MLVHKRSELQHIDTVQTVGNGFNFALCQDSLDLHRWLIGLYDGGSYKGFIKSIRIVYK